MSTVASGREATTVAIVGAGPAGLVLAYLLHRERVSFVLLEKHREADLTQQAKAGLVEWRTVQLLRAEGIADAVLRFDVTNGQCEFRTPDEQVVFDYGSLTGGRPHYIYPQHELQAKLCEALLAVGADIRFATTVASMSEAGNAAVLTLLDEQGAESTLCCQYVVGCDGAHSVVASAMPGLTAVTESLPVRWLGVLGSAPPLEPYTIYAAHPRGFAGQMRRGPGLTRYFLEIDAADAVADWAEERIRDELSRRLLVPGRLDAVPLGEPTLLDLRLRMVNTMQVGRMFLAGDAAHLVTPAGGKGMNLAIQDAVELAHGLAESCGGANDKTRLVAYSCIRLAAAWRTQAFSRWMLQLIVAGSDRAGAVSAADGGFARGLRQGWVAAVQADPLLARWFAHAYAGVEPS